MDLIKNQKKLRPQTVLEQLGRLSCHYPNSAHSEQTLKVVAVDWYEEFKTIDNKTFVELINEIIRTSRFFPAMVDIRDKHGVLFGYNGTCQYCKSLAYQRCPGKTVKSIACEKYEKGVAL